MDLAKITIIIPVLNEAAKIESTLKRVKTADNVEIIVVDGGSKDNTVEIAQAMSVKVIQTTPGRAYQMNKGAEIAQGDILLFLHGDTLLPLEYDQLVRKTLAQPEVIAGAFELKIDGKGRSLRLVEKMVNKRSHFFSLPYGDQAIFLKASTFQQLEGFPLLPIMEDFEFILKLRKLGTILIVPQSVITSGRRWQKLGVVKTTIINQVIIIGYFLGIPPQQLARLYGRNLNQKSKI